MKAKTIRAEPRADEGIHIRFIATSLFFAVFGGFTLAVSLPIEGLLGSVDASWVAHAQVHGHIQVIGFAGLFVMGMAFRLTPRFGGRRSMALPGAERWVWVLVAGGVLARSIGQPLADHTPFAALTMVGAAAEVSGTLLFGAMIWLTLSDAARARQPHALLMVGAACGLIAQSLFGFWWLTRMAADGGTLVPAAEARVLVHLQLFGFLLPAILGVGVRSFPTFFAKKPPGVGVGGTIAILAIGGITLWTAGGVLAASGHGEQWILAATGQGISGAAILVAIWTFGPWRRATRLAAASKGLAWSIQPAVLWLGLTGVLLVATSLRALIAGEAVSVVTLDALRHVFAVGVVSLAIVGMAQLILPEFASERLVRTPGGWRGPFFGIAISTAALLRGLVLLVGIEGDARWWAMAVSGSLGWLALATFATLYWRAYRSHRAYLQRISRARESAVPIASE